MVQSHKSLLHVRSLAHLGGRTKEHPHLSGPHVFKKLGLCLVAVEVMNEGTALGNLSVCVSGLGRFADAIAHTHAQVADTRKTIPGLRALQKYAVRCGGGENHRIALYDAILIKENHIIAAGGIAQAVAAAKAVAAAATVPCKFIQVEVENLEELRQALAAGATMVLLDNMSLADMAEASRLAAGQAVLEASGGVSLETVRAIAETGVDRISIGGLTKDVQALDLSMRFKAG